MFVKPSEPTFPLTEGLSLRFSQPLSPLIPIKSISVYELKSGPEGKETVTVFGHRRELEGPRHTPPSSTVVGVKDGVVNGSERRL